VGDTNEDTVLPPKDAVALLNRENNCARCYMIGNSNHSYQGREAELVKIIRGFLIDILANLSV
jgi:hypothetical protein